MILVPVPTLAKVTDQDTLMEGETQAAPSRADSAELTNPPSRADQSTLQGTRCTYWGVGVGVIQFCPADLISAEIGTSSAALCGHTKRDLLGQPEAAAESPTAGAAAGQGAELMQGRGRGGLEKGDPCPLLSIPT